MSTCKVGDLVDPPPAGALVVSPLQLTDSAAVGSAASRVRALEVLIENGSGLRWYAQRVQGSSWLVLAAASGIAPDTVTVSLNPAGLAVGVYRDTLVVGSDDTDADPLRVPVQFSVHPCRDTELTLDAVVNAALSNADCASPAQAGHYARRYRFAAAGNDSLSVELQATGFNGLIRLDTVTASPAPAPYPPSLFETNECLGVVGDPCVHYLRLPATRDYVVEVTTTTAGATGTIAMSVHRPRAPLVPDTLTERATDSVTTLIQPGNVSADTALVLRGSVRDPDGIDTLRLEVEVRPIGTSFTGTPTAVSGFGPVDRRAFVALSGLGDDTQYHWQARTVDQTGRASAWVSAGANAETTPDFSVNRTEAPSAPTALAQFREDGATPIVLGGINNTLTAVFKGVVTDADPGDQLRLEVEVKPVGTPFNQIGIQSGTPVASGATASTTVPGLVDGTAYHWRARTVDQTARASAWVSFGGNPESGADFSVQVPAQALQFIAQPSSVVAGAAISPAVQVRAVDAQGNTLTSFTSAVTISIESGPPGATITGTPTVNAVAGVATFNNLRFPKVGSYVLRATSGGLFDTSAGFTVTHAPAAKLTFTAQPVSAGAGDTLPPIQVTAQDQFDNTATSFTSLVTVALGNNPGNDGVLDGTTSVAAVAGVATFSTLDIDEADTSYTLTASASGLTGATSTPFNIFAGGVARVLFNAEPTTTTAGVNMTTVQVRAVDQSGNTVTSFNGQVQLAILNNPGGGTLLGTNPRPANSGIASFNNLRIEKAGVGYTLLATVVGAPAIGPDTSAAFTILPAAPSKLAFTVQPPATTTAGIAMAPAIVVAVQDQFDNTVTSSTASIAIAILNNPGNGTLSGTTPVTASGGLATFGNLSINKSGVGYTLRATSSGLSSATSNGFTIQAGLATKLTFSVPPGNTIAGVDFSPAVQVTALDAFDNTATSFTGNVTVAIGTNPPPGGGVLDGTKVVAAVAGVANFPGLNIDEARTGYTLTASANGLSGVTSAPFNITPAPGSRLEFTVQPSRTTAGVVIAPAVQVTARDSLGNPATGFAGNVTVAITPGTGKNGATLSGTLTRLAASGVATFNDLRIDSAATNYTLTASAAGLVPDTSAAFLIDPSAPTRLAFTTQPTSTVAGAIIPTVRVTALDSLGNTVPTFTGVVTITITTNPAGGILTGTLQRAAVAGVATFNDLSIDKAGAGYTLGASSPSTNPVTSQSFNIVPGLPTHLVFTVQPPASAQAGQTFSPAVQVTARDQLSNVATGFTGNVTVEITPGTGKAGANLLGTLTRAAVAGVATFDNLRIDSAGTAYTLTARSGTLTRDTSTALTINPGVTTQLKFTVQPPPSGSAGAPLSPAIQVSAQDAFGNLTPSFTQTVTMTIGNNPSNSTLTGTPSVAASAGVATFSNLRLDKVGTAYTLIAVRAGLISPESTPFNITAAAPSSIAIAAGDGQSATVGTAVATDPSVIVRDPFNNPVAGVSVTFGVTGGGGAVVPTTPILTNASGIATVTSWTLGTAAGPNTLQASAAGLTPATFTATGTAGPATQMSISAGNGQSTAVGTAVAIDPSVIVRDQFNNPVPGVSVTFTVTGGGGAVVPTTPIVTTASGIATVTSWTLGTTPGTNTLQASATGLTPVNFTATATVGTPTQMVVNAGNGQSAAVGTAVAIDPSVTVRDQFSNPVPGVSVTFAVTGGGGAVVPTTPIVTNASGIATVTSWTLGTTAGANTLQASATGLTPVTFTATGTAGPVSAAQSTVSAAPTTITASNGSSASTITVTARDAFGNPISGATVVLAATGTGNTLTQPTGTTNASGVATGTLSSTIAGSKTVSATIGGVGITQTATVTVSAGAVGAAQSTVSAAPTTINASGGASQSTITVTARDALGNPISGLTVVLAATGTGNTLTQPVGTTNASGVATGTLSSTDAGTKTVSATAGGVGITQTATVTVNAGPVSAAQSTVSAAPTTINASGGASQSTITVTARDALGNPISGLTVVLAATGTGNTLTQPAGPTNGSGVATGTLSSTDAGTKTVSATAGGVGITQTATVTVSAGAVSAAQSTVSAAPTTITASNGTSQSTITVTARDALGNPISGLTVVLAATGTGNTLTQPAGQTNASGVATGTLSSTDAGTKTVSATAGGVGITQTATVTVNAGAVSAAQSTVSALPTTIAASNGTSQSTITVTARDALGNPISGLTVVLAATGTGNTLTQPAGTTNASGVATGTLSSTDAGTKTVSATAGGVGITQTATVTVSAGTVSAAQSTVSAAPTTINASSGASQSTITVTARDVLGNPINGLTVVLAATGTGNTLTQPAGTTNASGVATGTLSSTDAGTKTVSATAGGVGIAQTATVTVAAGTVTKLQFTVEPSSAVAGATITPPVQVAAQDAFGNTVTAYTSMVTLTIGPGPGGGTLSGGGQRSAVAGVATFDALSINAAANGYTLVASRASGPQIASDTSATFDIAAGTVSATQSTVSASPTTITASSGASQSTITVTARDAQGNPISGATVVLAATGTGNTLTQPVGTTNGSGVATGTLSSTVAAAKTVSATINGIGIAQTATVTVNPAAVSAAQSSMSAAPTTVTASTGSSQSTITVTARDQFNNPISGATVVLAATGTGNTLTQPAGTTNGAGVATGTLSSTDAGTKTVSATAGGVGITQTATVTVNVGAVSAAQSTVSAAPASITASNGTSQSTITVTARDALGNPISGLAVVLAATGTGNTLTQPAGTTNGSGVATGTLSSTDAGTKTVSATAGGVGITQTAAVTVSAGAVSAAQSTVSAVPGTITASSGASQSTITVTARDAQGNPISGANVVISATGTGNTVTQPAGATDASGVATGTLSSTVAEGKTVSATANGVPITQSPVVTVNPAGAAQMTISTGDGQSATAGTNVATPPAVLITDQFGNPVANVEVIFTVILGGGSVAGSPATTNASGIATVTSWTLGPTLGTNTLEASSGSLTPVTFTATGN